MKNNPKATPYIYEYSLREGSLAANFWLIMSLHIFNEISQKYPLSRYFLQRAKILDPPLLDGSWSVGPEYVIDTSSYLL